MKQRRVSCELTGGGGHGSTRELLVQMTSAGDEGGLRCHLPHGPGPQAVGNHGMRTRMASMVVDTKALLLTL